MNSKENVNYFQIVEKINTHSNYLIFRELVVRNRSKFHLLLIIIPVIENKFANNQYLLFKFVGTHFHLLTQKYLL